MLYGAATSRGSIIRFGMIGLGKVGSRDDSKNGMVEEPGVCVQTGREMIDIVLILTARVASAVRLYGA